MKYPIVAYGDPVLRKKTEEINSSEEGVSNLINDMFETMYGANGVGLAAPQIGKSLRIFVIDSAPLEENSQDGIKSVFINPVKIEESGNERIFEEGCLSIPDIRGDVERKSTIKLRYLDSDFNPQEETFEGIKARIIQHEYDHLEGVLFTDYLSTLKKQLLRGKLSDISKGKISVPYPMIFPKKKKK